MLPLSEFKKNFGKLSIPNALIQLLDFQNSIGEDVFYAQGFQLAVIENEGVRTYSEDDIFLKSLIEFAQADGTGSSYSFWLRDSTRSLDDAPIVIFGSEGGYHVIAQNIVELFKVLTLEWLIGKKYIIIKMRLTSFPVRLIMNIKSGY